MTTYPTAQELIDRKIINPNAVQLFDRGDSLGKAVRALIDLNPGDAACSYGGQEVPKTAICTSDYKFDFDATTILDGDPKHPETMNHLGSFINDAKGVVQFVGQRNNVVFKKSYFVDENGVRRKFVLVVASRPIKAGEELWLSYGSGYWKTFRREKKIKTIVLPIFKKTPTIRHFRLSGWSRLDRIKR